MATVVLTKVGIVGVAAAVGSTLTRTAADTLALTDATAAQRTEIDDVFTDYQTRSDALTWSMTIGGAGAVGAFGFTGLVAGAGHTGAAAVGQFTFGTGGAVGSVPAGFWSDTYSDTY